MIFLICSDLPLLGQFIGSVGFVLMYVFFYSCFRLGAGHPDPDPSSVVSKRFI